MVDQPEPARDDDAPQAGAGRAIEAAYARRHPPAAAPRALAAAPGPQDEDDLDDEEDDEDDDDDDEEDDDGEGDDDTFDDYGEEDENLQMAPEEDPTYRIEDEPTDTSIIGDGHADKAAWNRERVHHLQEVEEEHPHEDTEGSQAILGHGNAPDGNMRGMETGDGVLEELTEEHDLEAYRRDTSIEDDMRLGDAEDVLDDESAAVPNNTPFLPEHRDLPDEDIPLEERLLATEGEDAIVSGAELGLPEEMEMEDLNETDNISQQFEDMRDRLDESMSGNERQADND